MTTLFYKLDLLTSGLLHTCVTVTAAKVVKNVAWVKKL